MTNNGRDENNNPVYANMQLVTIFETSGTVDNTWIRLKFMNNKSYGSQGDNIAVKFNNSEFVEQPNTWEYLGN